MYDLYGLKSTACEIHLVGLSGLPSQQESIWEDLAEKSTYWTSIEIQFNSRHETLSDARSWALLLRYPRAKNPPIHPLLQYPPWCPALCFQVLVEFLHHAHHVSIMLWKHVPCFRKWAKKPSTVQSSQIHLDERGLIMRLSSKVTRVFCVPIGEDLGGIVISFVPSLTLLRC